MAETEIVFDLETDNLIDNVTQVWCATFYNTSMDKYISFVPVDKLLPNEGNRYYLSLDNLPKWLNSKKDQYIFVGHNILRFDKAVFKKLYDIEIPLEHCQDTYLWSQMLWPDIPIPKGCKGKHSLDAWGARFGIPKPKHEDWSQYSEDMLIRNLEDVRINVKLWEKIREKVYEK